MFLQEPRYHIGTKGEGHSTVIFAPPGNVLVGVGPEKIAEEATVGNLARRGKKRKKKDRSIEIGLGRGGKIKLTSVGLITLRICSIEFKSGDRPPCIVKIFSSMMAAMGRQLKQSVNVFHNLML